MDSVILDGIPTQLQRKELFGRLRVGEDSPHAPELHELILQAESIARPKALCGIAYIDERDDDHVVIDGVRFQSHVLAVNVRETDRVFPYLATCGTELEEWSKGLDDMVHSYWAGAIREAVMRLAMSATSDYVRDRFGTGELSRMSPGSLEDWPIQEQQPLFRLLGDTRTAVGVELTDSLMMVPTKTVSGIRFETSRSFESCMLCPRSSCPNRRAPQDPSLIDSRYR